MPIAYYKTPIGIIRITEEDDYITSIYAMDEEYEALPPETPLLQKAVQQLDEYFAGHFCRDG